MFNPTGKINLSTFIGHKSSVSLQNQIKSRMSSHETGRVERQLLRFCSLSAAPKYIPFNLETYELKRQVVCLSPQNTAVEEVIAVRYLGDKFSEECWGISKLKDYCLSHLLLPRRKLNSCWLLRVSKTVHCTFRKSVLALQKYTKG